VRMYITETALLQLRNHMAACYPEEGCALLIGRVSGDGVVFDVESCIAVPNIAAPDTRRTGYVIDPADIARADRTARTSGLDIIGVAHSHPDHPAMPSARDLDEAWPMFAYVIVSVQTGVAVDLRVWRVEAGQALALEIDVVTG
jgi:proteasome lid subunit RPN8/RPN11